MTIRQRTRPGFLAMPDPSSADRDPSKVGQMRHRVRAILVENPDVRTETLCRDVLELCDELSPPPAPSPPQWDVAALRAALVNYGQHRRDCATGRCEGCTCGFAEKL